MTFLVSAQGTHAEEQSAFCLTNRFALYMCSVQYVTALSHTLSLVLSSESSAFRLEVLKGVGCSVCRQTCGRAALLQNRVLSRGCLDAERHHYCFCFWLFLERKGARKKKCSLLCKRAVFVRQEFNLPDTLLCKFC